MTSSLALIVSNFTLRSLREETDGADVIELTKLISSAPLVELFDIVTSPNADVRNIIGDVVRNRLQQARYSFNSLSSIVTISYGNDDGRELVPYLFSYRIASNEDLILQPGTILSSIDLRFIPSLQALIEVAKPSGPILLKIDEEYYSLLQLLNQLLSGSNEQINVIERSELNVL